MAFPSSAPRTASGDQPLEFVTEPFKHLPNPCLARASAVSVLIREHIQPGSLAGRNPGSGPPCPERPGTVEAHHRNRWDSRIYLADVPGVAVEHVNELLVPTLQAPEGREEKQQGNGCKRGYLAVVASQDNLDADHLPDRMLLWMADTSMSGWAEGPTAERPLIATWVKAVSSW